MDNDLALAKVMAWHQIGKKPLPNPDYGEIVSMNPLGIPKPGPAVSDKGWYIPWYKPV